MFKNAKDLEEGEFVVRDGHVRKINKVEKIGDGFGIMITFEPKPLTHMVETFKPAQLVETVSVEVDISESQKRREELTDEGFEPGRWWQAVQNGKLLAETSNPIEFKSLGLLDQSDITIRRIYTRTENVWVEEEVPDV